MTDDGPRTLQTVEMTCSVIGALVELNGAGVTELANHLEISKGAVYNHLATLRKHEFVIKQGDTYNLSYQFFNYGMHTRNQTDIYNAAKPELETLSSDVGEYAHLMVEEFGNGIYLAKIQGKKGIADEYHVKKFEARDPLHISSTGKAILAHLPEDRITEIIDEHGLPRYTKNTITDRDSLFEELAEIRDQGYALNDEEEIRGVRAVGAPVFDANGDVIGSISVSGPISRIKDEAFHDTIPDKVMGAANVIEVSLETGQMQPQL